ncbi:hypothetical protein [Photorhabdus laumondii]|uniref:hypothetical protein n=1 Tax=Photorhabdus laumondii TaxID=2218628 RepID=UPI0033162BF3
MYHLTEEKGGKVLSLACGVYGYWKTQGSLSVNIIVLDSSKLVFHCLPEFGVSMLNT